MANNQLDPKLRLQALEDVVAEALSAEKKEGQLSLKPTKLAQWLSIRNPVQNDVFPEAAHSYLVETFNNKNPDVLVTFRTAMQKAKDDPAFAGDESRVLKLRNNLIEYTRLDAQLLEKRVAENMAMMEAPADALAALGETAKPIPRTQFVPVSTVSAPIHSSAMAATTETPSTVATKTEASAAVPAPSAPSPAPTNAPKAAEPATAATPPAPVAATTPVSETKTAEEKPADPVKETSKPVRKVPYNTMIKEALFGDSKTAPNISDSVNGSSYRRIEMIVPPEKEHDAKALMAALKENGAKDVRLGEKQWTIRIFSPNKPENYITFRPDNMKREDFERCRAAATALCSTQQSAYVAVQKGKEVINQNSLDKLETIIGVTEINNGADKGWAHIPLTKANGEEVSKVEAEAAAKAFGASIGGAKAWKHKEHTHGKWVVTFKPAGIREDTLAHAGFRLRTVMAEQGMSLPEQNVQAAEPGTTPKILPNPTVVAAAAPVIAQVIPPMTGSANTQAAPGSSTTSKPVDKESPLATANEGAPNIMQVGVSDVKSPESNPVNDNKWGMIGLFGGLMAMMAMGLDIVTALVGAVIIGAIASAFGDASNGTGLIANFFPSMSGKKDVELKQGQAVYISKDGAPTADKSKAAYEIAGGTFSSQPKKDKPTEQEAILKDVSIVALNDKGERAGTAIAIDTPIVLKNTKDKDGKDVYSIPGTADFKALKTALDTKLAEAAENATKPSAPQKPLTLSGFDKNDDKKLDQDELKTLIAKYDTNKDDKLTAVEVPEAMKAEFQALLDANKGTGGKTPTEITPSAPLNLPAKPADKAPTAGF